MISLVQLQQRPHVSLTEAGVIPIVLPVALSLHLHMLVTATLVTLTGGCRTHSLCIQGSWNSRCLWERPSPKNRWGIGG